MYGIGGTLLKSFALEFPLDLKRIKSEIEITKVFLLQVFLMFSRVKTWFRIKHAEAYLNKK